MSEIPTGEPVAAPEITIEPTAAAPEAAVAVPEVAAPGPVQVVPHTDTPGLLSATPAPEAAPAESAPEPERPAEPEKPAEEAKPAETPEAKEPEAKPPEAKPAEPAVVAPPEPLKYEPLAVPEGLTLLPERVQKFDDLIGAHRLPAEVRQELADMHIGEMQAYAQKLAADQHKAFAETRAGWRQEIKGDEELGGAAFDTNRAAATRMLQLFVEPKRRGAFDEALLLTGMADHPEFMRMMVNIARKFDEPSPSPQPRNPPPDIGKRSGRGLRSLYTHPTSSA